MNKFHYTYDFDKGHYIVEDDNLAQSDKQQQQDNQKNSEQNNEIKSFKSVESDETIMNLTKTLNDKKSVYDREMAALNTQLAAAKNQVASKVNDEQSGGYDPVATNPDILSLENKILTKKTEYNTFEANIMRQILARKKQLSAIKEAKDLNMPDKLVYLINESAVSKCKIYITDLIGEGMPIFNKYSMNRCFKNTNLIYGKDRNKYFVVLVDEDDVNELYDALISVGYEKEDIQTVILSQLLNRRHMV